MKIVVICGCLEPGLDGVGDYVQRISDALISKGHHVALIALKDKYTENLFSDIKKYNSLHTSVYRIPAGYSARRRYSILAKLVNELDPDWVSLQYVGFSYERYGLPLKMPFYIKKITRNSKLHITLHELWCGMDKYSKWTEKLLGFVQKLFLRLFIRTLKPRLIFTSIEFYREELSSLGINSIVTPIFGNIPLYDFGSDEIWDNYVCTSELNLITKQPKDWLVITFFGTVYPCPGLDQLLHTSLEAAKKINQKLAVICIGNNRLSSMGELTKSFQNIKYFSLGILSLEFINRIFNLTTFGVMTSPANRLNKSGSCVAMLERGIPILISPLDRTYRIEMEKGGIYQVLGLKNILSALDQIDGLLKRSTFSEAADSYSNLDALIEN